MTIDPIYLAAFALTSCGAAFALGRFCRNGGSTGAWEGATSTTYEGMALLGTAEEVADLREYIAGLPADIASGPYGATYKERLRRLVGEPSPHADGKGGVE